MVFASSDRRNRSRVKSSFVRNRLSLEALEERVLLDVTLGRDPTNGLTDVRYFPPDTQIAAGQNYNLEVINSTMAFFDKDGNRVLSRTLRTFFAPNGVAGDPYDPVVTYQEQYHRWVVGALEGLPQSVNNSWINLAVSEDDTSDGFDPSTAFSPSRMFRIDARDSGTFADYPKIGWNADAIVMSTNQIGSNPHADLYPFDLAAILADPSSLTVHRVRPPGSNQTLAPATMHDAKPGDPMWLVERGTTNNTERVVRMDDVLSDTPTFTFTSVTVPVYGTISRASQPDGPNTIDVIDARIMNAAYRNGRLLAAHHINGGGAPRVRWYEFDVSSGTPAPSPTQTGEINQGPGVGTYYPSIDINAAGDLGMTFMESSASEYMSMYVTGQSVFDAGDGTMQDPVETHMGINFYRGDGRIPYRAGDYGGMSVDPVDDFFWGAHMYKGTSQYNTGIANFSVSPNGLAPRGRALFLNTISIAAAPINVAVEGKSLKPSSSTDAVLDNPDGRLDVASVNRLFALAPAENPAKVLASRSPDELDWDADKGLLV